VSSLNDFDINELVLQLHGELKFAFEVANAAEKEAGMQLQTVKARMGRKDLLPEGDAGGSNLNGLNPDRYPDKEDWEVEVSYEYGNPLAGIPKSQNWVSTADSRLVLERLGNEMLVHIKGVNRVWVQRFAEAQILTVEKLALASHEKILEICKQYNSMAPLEFQTKVLLLVRDFTPLSYTGFYNQKLFLLLENNLYDLKRLFKGKLSGPEISNLRVMASIIQLVFDKGFAGKLRMDLFAK
jgi:hypothetical protein